MSLDEIQCLMKDQNPLFGNRVEISTYDNVVPISQRLIPGMILKDDPDQEGDNVDVIPWENGPKNGRIEIRKYQALAFGYFSNSSDAARKLADQLDSKAGVRVVGYGYDPGIIYEKETGDQLRDDKLKIIRIRFEIEQMITAHCSTGGLCDEDCT